MSAGTHTRIHGPAVHTAQTRLPWWALALPSLAFLALLTLILAAPEARAAAGASFRPRSASGRSWSDTSGQSALACRSRTILLESGVPGAVSRGDSATLIAPSFA